MSDEDRTSQELAQYRLKRSADDLDAARLMFTAGKDNAAANRAYYSIFHAIRAVFALDRKIIANTPLSSVSFQRTIS